MIPVFFFITLKVQCQTLPRRGGQKWGRNSLNPKGSGQAHICACKLCLQPGMCDTSDSVLRVHLVVEVASSVVGLLARSQDLRGVEPLLERQLLRVPVGLAERAVVGAPEEVLDSQ